MFGVDYAFKPHPSVSALKAAGARFAVRYVSDEPANDTNGKNLLPAECKALLSAGISVCLVVEYYAKRMLEGKARGAADATHADAVATALGMPGIPVYFAVDWDATPGDQAGINDYLDGAASVIGRSRIGVYGSYYVCQRALNAGKAAYAWQTYAWSGGLWEGRAQLRQYENGVSIGGASVDKNDSRADDFGQWPRPVSAGPFRHEVAAGNKLSLHDVAVSRSTTADRIVERSKPFLNPANAAILDAYVALDTALRANSNPHPVMPEGLVYYTVNR